MQDRIVRLEATDFDALMAHLSHSFGLGQTTAFDVLLPALYRRTDRYMACNRAVKRNGRIVAVVGVFPVYWHVGGARLHAAGIGGVSTDPDCRGQGLMRRLMSHCVEEIRAEGYDLSFLGGQRQRYRYFGYDRAGLRVSYRVTTANLMHEFGQRRSPVRLSPMPRHAEAVRFAKGLHDAGAMYCERSASSFHAFLRNWTSSVWLAHNSRGVPVGYLSGNVKNGRIAELASNDENTALNIVRAWVPKVEQGGGATVSCDGLPSPFGRRLGGLAEWATVEASGNWQVFSWAKVLDALLKAKHAAVPLPAGEVVLGVKGLRPTLRLSIDQDGARCEAARARPHITADPCAMLRLLCGPTTPDLVCPLPEQASVLNAWCPLPLDIPELDHV